MSQSGCVSSVRHILKNRRYTGQIIWNTKRKVRAPGTGRRVYRRRPESEWVVTPAPDLQIVPAELFAAIERRFEITQKLWGAGVEVTGLTRGHAKQAYLQVGKFALERVQQDGKITFKANGKIDFFGDEALTRLSGAGGPDCTVRTMNFSLPVAT